MSVAMNPRVKTLWVDALRSGNYKQGRGALHDVINGHCCLGVLCDLAVKAGVGAWITEPGKFMTTYSLGDWRTALFLCDGVRVWAGLPVAGPDGGIEGSIEGPLVEMNDAQLLTFGQIADWIEENL